MRNRPSLAQAIAATTAAATLATLSASAPARAQQWGYPAELVEFMAPLPWSDAKLVEPVYNLREMERRGLKKAKLQNMPWTSDFWPDVKGSIADPYMETRAGALKLNRVLWRADSVGTHIIDVVARENRPTLVNRSKMRKNIATAPDKVIDNLSPAEKYDFLLGDENFTFTRNVIQMVDERDSHDLVNSGAGLCHGWAPASLNVRRPERSVTLISRFGRPVTFYPTDIKALIAMLWGKSGVPTRTQGWKCQTGGRQDELGRPLDPKCYNVNPAFFHLFAVNQLGVNQRGFIMDKSSNADVWNYPVYAYEFGFFDVTDRTPWPTMSFDKAKVSVATKEELKRIDPLYRYRAPGTRALVGVEMKVHFTNITRDPKHTATDSLSQDDHKSIKIRYDLELDENDNVIGGEWRQYDDPTDQKLNETGTYARPNLVWHVPAGTEPSSMSDFAVADAPWDGKGPAPEAWLKASRSKDAQLIGASHHKGRQLLEAGFVDITDPQPLKPLVDLLLDLSSPEVKKPKTETVASAPAPAKNPCSANGEYVPGNRHSNGGGFVASTAYAAPTAFVAEGAYVCRRGKVLDNAKINNLGIVDDDAMVYGDAAVYGSSVIQGNAKVYGNASINGWAFVEDSAKVYGNAKLWSGARVGGTAEIYGKAEIQDNAKVRGSARAYDNAIVYGNAVVEGSAQIFGAAYVGEYATVASHARVSDLRKKIALYHNTKVMGHATVIGNAQIKDGASIWDWAAIGGQAVITDDETTVGGNARVTEKVTVRKASNVTGRAFLKGDHEYSHVFMR
jgi:UDP-3-O-[3-hydroxymyristoyl] glucosamine N-acyltransferase